MVAIDIDGTLLNSAKQITQATASILHVATKQMGVHVVLATARPPRSVMRIYERLGLDTPMINYNGAMVFDPPQRRVVMHRPISLKTADDIIHLAREAFPEIVVSAEILDRWCTDRFESAWLTETVRHFRPNVVAPIEQWLTEPVTKLLLLGPPEDLAELARLIREAHLHQVSIIQTEGYMLQISHTTVSKREALKTVASDMGVAQRQVMAIGDNANDIEMLQWAGIGVAMANAPDAVKAAADHITDHHDADGAAKAVHDLIIKGRED